ncbi:UDP-N-acetylmuramate dehydrogenase /UDP-N-acetylmuramate--L-alanine ligase [Verrucomicrobium sp. GAS474]|uniref:UDP-N-acetylmuramate--L-alanine ligase n=1 Tax=Verrucomicrobium sp. GAS474 TaxID=1882831 RepID=UPI00087A2C26|nr:UDP-N-acetylmuramate--L-alanine ligase [Verrucomicrobium sp. GAS474]SDU28752.1 UDP-N-acetylmuramate dehydrogenase /UDP-N-acetylmuramate--L-alanine ligase [Verrucomicrobium sp. GAS474]
MREEVRAKIVEVLKSEGARIHLVGVGGTGMSALARLLIGAGYRVSGSDLHASVPVEKLVGEGLVFYPKHVGTVVLESDLVVYSSAIGEGNPERLEAQRLGVPSVRRAEVLAVLAERRQSIVVAGMHGKTTTSSMLAHVLRGAGLRPSHYVGAEVPILGASAGWDGEEGSPLVIEGDESDGTLVAFRPAHAILLNIEEEHLDHYGDLKAILKAFSQFLDQTKGKVVYCADDENTALLCSNRKEVISYGIGETAAYRAVNITARNFVSEFEVLRDGIRLGRVVLEVPGFQNVRNALGVIAMAMELGVPFEAAAAALLEFRGATRRFEVRYKSENFMVIDDYAHHPTEVRATLAAARSGGWKRVVALFQPHRYTRTQSLQAEFAAAFADADLLFLTDIYAANEEPIEGVTGEAFAAAVEAGGHPKVQYEADLRKLRKIVAREIEPGDLVITMGAGNIHEAASTLASELAWYEGLKKTLSPESALLRQEPMRKHTSIRIGGPAQFWFEPASLDDLAVGLRYAKRHSVPVTFIGRGTNLLVRDGGIRGLSIYLGTPAFSKVEFDGERITAGAGAILRAIVAAAKKKGLGGISFMEGIPGNLGGALRMNAGAMQGWTMEVIEQVKTVDRDGNVRTYQRDQLEVYYRNVPVLRDEIAIEAVIRTKPLPVEQIEEELKGYSKKRWTSQPAAPSAGCIFKNPGPAPAGKLIDDTGLKNLSFGKARVSDVHGNFIVNDGGATAEEVQTLMKTIQQRIKDRHGIDLDPEVIIIGDEL